MNITELLGKRVLLKLGTAAYSRAEVTEYKILEISPSCNWVKLQNIYGNKFWRSLQEVAFIEELRELSAGKPEGA